MELYTVEYFFKFDSDVIYWNSFSLMQTLPNIGFV